MSSPTEITAREALAWLFRAHICSISVLFPKASRIASNLTPLQSLTEAKPKKSLEINSSGSTILSIKKLKNAIVKIVKTQSFISPAFGEPASRAVL